MIGTEESNNLSTGMDSASMICDKTKGLKLNCFSEKCIKLCSHENEKNGVKFGVKHKKRQDVVKYNGSNYH